MRPGLLPKSQCPLGSRTAGRPAELQIFVHDHEISGAFLVTLLVARNLQNTGGLELAKSSHHFGMGVKPSFILYPLGMEILF